MTPSDAATVRPRVAGDRELEILEATLAVLADVGYDRLTMDAVATAAKASKATLYRRWTTKATLVIDALLSRRAPLEAPDTGSLRGDLLASLCGTGGMLEGPAVATFSAVLTALTHDEEFAAEFRTRVVAPKLEHSRAIYERAIARGELRSDLDASLFAPALAGILLHRVHVLGEVPTVELVTRIIDQIVLPAALAPTPTDTTVDTVNSEDHP